MSDPMNESFDTSAFTGDTMRADQTPITFLSLTNSLLYLPTIVYDEVKTKDVVISKKSHAISNKVFSQSSLPIKAEARPQLRNNYKPNTYINKNYRNKH